MHKVFSSRSHASSDAWHSWAALSRREFYDGDLGVESDETPEFTFDKALSYPISLTRLTSRTPLSYRRSWQHIRNNKVGFRVIWFVRRGSLKIVRTTGDCQINANEVGILDSNVPFHATLQCDDEGVYESYQAIVPAHLFLTHLQKAEKLVDAVSLDTPQGRVVQGLLDMLASEGDHLSREAAKPLAESLLEVLADSLGCRHMDTPRRQRLIDLRLKDIENYILMNLTDPDLCFDKVAASCGISPRYLCYLLKADNTSFSELLWKNRLPKARDWLISPATREYPIHEIAFMSGFKSAAHFSRMFKAAYGCPPREYRAAHSRGESRMEAEIEDIVWHGDLETA